MSSSGAITGIPTGSGTATVSFLAIDATGARRPRTPRRQRHPRHADQRARDRRRWPLSRGTPVPPGAGDHGVPGDRHGHRPSTHMHHHGASDRCTLAGLVNGITYRDGHCDERLGAGTRRLHHGRPHSRRAHLSNDRSGSTRRTRCRRHGGGHRRTCGAGTTCATAPNVLTRWEDKSGSNNDAVQSTPSMAGVRSGMPAVDSLTPTAGTARWSPPALTAFAVAQSDTDLEHLRLDPVVRRPNGAIIPARGGPGWYPTDSAAAIVRR
jgi:hypothetical protein